MIASLYQSGAKRLRESHITQEVMASISPRSHGQKPNVPVFITMGSSPASIEMTTILNEVDAPAARRNLQPDECVLVVVDIQEKLLPPIFNKEQLVRNSQLLIRLAGLLTIPVIATTQYAKGLGGTVPEIASLLNGVATYDKLGFSCFGSDQFCGEMKSLPASRNTVLVCGMEAHICVTQTVLGALN